MKFARNMLVVLLAALAGSSAAQDPTRPSPVLADRLREKALDAQTLRVKALVVGAGEEGVALVRLCSTRLEDAERKVKILTESHN